MTIPEIQQAMHAWNTHNFPGAPSWQALLGAGEELGELFHSALKRFQGIRGTEQEHRQLERDAIGDLLIYLMSYSNREGYDLEACVNEAWEEIRDRDWQRYPGNGRDH